MTEIMLEHAPTEWPIKRLGQLFLERKEIVSDKNFPALSVTKQGIVPQLETAAKSDDSDNRKGVWAGDFVINSRSDRKGSGGLSELTGSVSLINIVLEPQGIYPRFAHHLLRSSAFQEEFYRWGHGIVADLWTTRFSEMKNIRVAVPDLETQKAIVTFLDRETTRIDQLIAKKERQVVFLDQRARQAVNEIVVGQGVTSGPSLITGLDYMPRIPAHWTLRRAGRLFQQVAEPNTDDLPVLSVSLHTGISDRQLDDEERDRKITLIEDRSSYKRVRPGYLAYNMMRAWQGAVGVSIVDGAVSPAYVVAKPTRDLYSPYYQFLLRTSPFIELMRQRSKGITDFRLRLYWEQFRLIMLPVPPLDEQKRIANDANRELIHAEKVVSKITASIELLKERRAALVTAAVTGQIDIRSKPINVTVKPDRAKFRLIVGAEIIHRHQNTRRFGRVKNQKLLYLAEAHAGIGELQGNYLRWAAGPYDAALTDEVDRSIETAFYFQARTTDGDGQGVAYVPLSKAGQHSNDLEALLGNRLDTLRKTVDLLHDFETESVEAIATLYAVWNDALIDGERPDDDRIIRGVLNEWHEKKVEKFKRSDLERWLDWMRRNGFVPRGQGPRTIPTMTGDLFR